MSRKHRWKTKLAACMIVGGLLASSVGCVTDNFWVTQVDNTLTSIVEAVVGNTVVAAIDTVLGS